MKSTGCVLTFRNSAVLAVSRPDPPLRFGLPGGRIERGEAPIDGAARELFEETGYVATDLEHVYSAISESRLVHMFFAPTVSGSLRSSHEGIAAWVEPRVVLCGAYPLFTRQMFSELGLATPRC
jgi:8-oxo-dGTP pyrophosphatase MutT (NUDIX family)